MAELTLTAFVSLDGVMQAPGGPDEDKDSGFVHGGWMFPFADEVFGATVVENFANADAFLLGRRTYDIFAAYWPQQTDTNNPIVAALNGLPKHVASRGAPKLDWHDSHLVRDPVKELAALKRKYPRQLQVHGSANLVQTLFQHDLIDEFRTYTCPVVIGTGKRMFEGGAMPAAFTLKHTSTNTKGVVMSVYRRAGELTTGSFARGKVND